MTAWLTQRKRERMIESERERWIDGVAESLKDMNIDDWNEIVHGRDMWRCIAVISKKI